MAKKQGCTCESKIKSDDLDIVTHWYEDLDDIMWPRIPRILTYTGAHQVHLTVSML